MAITLDVKSEKVFELEEYLAYVEKNVCVSDRQSLIDSAPALLSLANNRRFIAHRLNAEIQAWRDFQSTNDYTAQTMMLGRGPGFVVRANIWMPYDAEMRNREWQQRLFFYTVAHDHNFDFLTVGYTGPGYYSDLYEYDRSSVIGLPGEPVDLVDRGRIRLDRGKVMLYRASQDIHAQQPPEAFSISLNLMVADQRMGLQEQYFFDTDKRCLRGPVESGVSNRVFLCEMARYVGDSRTRSLLDQIAAAHPCGRTRAMAVDSLVCLEPGDTLSLWRRAFGDSDPYLRHVARERLDSLAG